MTNDVNDGKRLTDIVPKIYRCKSMRYECEDKIFENNHDFFHVSWCISRKMSYLCIANPNHRRKVSPLYLRYKSDISPLQVRLLNRSMSGQIAKVLGWQGVGMAQNFQNWMPDGKRLYANSEPPCTPLSRFFLDKIWMYHYFCVFLHSCNNNTLSFNLLTKLI